MTHELVKRDYIYKGRVLDLSISRFVSAHSGEVDIEVIHHNGGAGAHLGRHVSPEGVVCLDCGSGGNTFEPFRFQISQQVLHHLSRLGAPPRTSAFLCHCNSRAAELM